MAFFGSSELSCTVLRHVLSSRHTVAAVITQPDQPAGRRMTLTPTPVAQLAAEIGLPTFKPARLRTDAALTEALRELHLDALLTASYGQIVPRSILELTPWPLNVHPSLLPKLRGASPIRTALLQGLAETGCCIMRMTPRLDDGPLLSRETLTVEPDWNHADLEEVLAEMGGRMAVSALDEVAAGTAVLSEQDHAEATYCGQYGRADTWIDWSRPAAELRDFIRAWDPDIGALTALPDGRRLKIWRAAVGSTDTYEGLPPGSVLAAQRELIVATGSGALHVLEVQPENKRRMPARDWLAGAPLKVGDWLGTPDG